MKEMMNESFNKGSGRQSGSGIKMHVAKPEIYPQNHMAERDNQLFQDVTQYLHVPHTHTQIQL